MKICVSIAVAVLIVAAVTIRSKADTLTATAADTIEDTSRFIVRIEPRITPWNKQLDTVDVTIESFGTPIAGFELKIGCDSRLVEISDVLPGRILDSCKWQFYNARPAPNSGKEGYPRSLWRVVALARLVTDTTEPSCFGFDKQASILRVVLSRQAALTRETLLPGDLDSAAALFFYWESCTDNSLSGKSGRTLIVSQSVLDYYPVALPDGASVFPTRKGTPLQCLVQSKRNFLIRRAEFHNGGIKLDYPSASHPRSRTSPEKHSPEHRPDSTSSTAGKR
ncbi:MAG TPA: hypothetical protein VMS71_05510 [Candidatus Acidoferrum sp.]|nr:hypothetical protein [Candidatus Acidoferrum sp.]